MSLIFVWLILLTCSDLKDRGREKRVALFFPTRFFYVVSDGASLTLAAMYVVM